MAFPSPRRPRTAFLTRRLWLPRWLYESLPLVYFTLGGLALTAAVAVPGATWVVPLFLVIAVGITHLGLWIATLRYRHRRRTAGMHHDAAALTDGLPAP